VAFITRGFLRASLSERLVNWLQNAPKWLPVALADLNLHTAGCQQAQATCETWLGPAGVVEGGLAPSKPRPSQTRPCPRPSLHNKAVWDNPQRVSLNWLADRKHVCDKSPKSIQ
jgi:hypothetical protein